MWWAWLIVGLWIGGFIGMFVFAWLVAASDADDATEAEETQAQATWGAQERRSVVGDGQMGRPGGSWMVRD